MSTKPVVSIDEDAFILYDEADNPVVVPSVDEASFVDLIDVPDFDDGSYIVRGGNLKCETIKVGSTKKWVGSKAGTEKHCVKVDGGILGTYEECFNVPVLYKRTCRKQVYARICYPSNLSNTIIKKIRKCAKVATGTTILAIILTDGVAPAYPIWIAAFEKCLLAESIDTATSAKIKAKLLTESVCGEWKKV